MGKRGWEEEWLRETGEVQEHFATLCDILDQ